MIIPAKPTVDISLYISHLFTKPKHNFDNFLFFKTGSEALIHAFFQLNIPKGEKVLLPAFVCRSVSDSIVQAGYKPIFVDLMDSLVFSEKELQKVLQMQNCKVVLLVDYFGFLEQENNQLARNLMRKGNTVVRDRCHSLLTSFNQNQIDTIGDATVFSLRKMLPVGCGGVLFIPKEKMKGIGKNSLVIKKMEFTFLLKGLIEFLLYKVVVINIYSAKIDNLRRMCARFMGRHRKFNKAESVGPVNPPKMVTNLYHKENSIKEICIARRNNYKKIEKIANKHGIKVVFPALTADVVPQVMPVYGMCSGLSHDLRESRVGSYNWPGADLPQEVKNDPDSFPMANQVSRNIVCLPIHQSISDREIRRIDTIITEIK